MQTVTIPRGVCSIGSSAFASCSSLEEVVIPDTVTAIETFAFSGCTALERAVLPKAITEIKKSLFQNCKSLTDVQIPDSVTIIGDSAFSGCTALEDVEFSENLTSIGNLAYSGCTAIKELDLPVTLKVIGNTAFNGGKMVLYAQCNSDAHKWIRNHPALKSVIEGHEIVIDTPWVAPTETKAGHTDVSHCTVCDEKFAGEDIPALNSSMVLRLPANLQAVEPYAFQGGSFKCVVIPEGCHAICAKAFADCPNLMYVKIPSKIKAVEKDAFDGPNQVIIDWYDPEDENDQDAP